MIILAHYRKAYAYFAVFLLIATLFSGRMLGFNLIMLVLIAFLVLVYIDTQWEYVFYGYILASIGMVIADFLMIKMNILHIAFLYAIMAPLLMHIVEMHFGRYGKIHENTYTIYMLSLPLSFITVFMALYIPRVLGMLAILLLSGVIIVIYYLLTAGESAE